MVLVFINFALLTEGFGLGVEITIHTQERMPGCPKLLPALAERRRIRRLHRPKAPIAAPVIGPQPACVTGPRQGMPCATITHTVPRSLHSTQTLWAGVFGLRL